MRSEFQHRINLLAVYARKPLEEIIHRGTVLQIPRAAPRGNIAQQIRKPWRVCASA